MLPLLLSWGLGLVDAGLDRLVLVSAAVAALPAVFGNAGSLALAGLGLAAVLSRRRFVGLGVGLLGFYELCCLLGALSLVSSAMAMSRPASWLAWAGVLLAVTRALPSPDRSLLIPRWFWQLLGLLCWLLAARARPFKDGLLGQGGERFIAGLIESQPGWLWEGLLLLSCLALVVWVLRAWRPLHSLWLIVLFAAGAALLFEHVFGGQLAAAPVVALLGVVGLLAPTRLTSGQGSLSLVMVVLLVCLIAELRLGITERWDCRALDEESGAKLLAAGVFDSIAVVPDNMPFIALLEEGGAQLSRLSPGGGGFSASVAVEPAGGQLVSPPSGTRSVGRLVQEPERLLVEWWDVHSLQRQAVRSIAARCDPGLSFMEPGGASMWISCLRDGTVLIVDPRPDGPVTSWSMGASVQGVQRLVGGVLVDTGGVDSRAGIYQGQGRGLAELGLGAYSSGIVSVSEYGEAFAVSRGPAGHVEVRGRAPSVEYQYPLDLNTAEGALEALGTRFDSARLGRWPARPHWIKGQGSVYVASAVDARVFRQDLEVTWHRASAVLGGVPYQVALDSSSESLFGINRCGVFEVKLKSTFPWRDLPAPAVPAQGAP
ncbi:MAG: hypothetical protein CMP23_01430 [Rickettsiales bacterium]|nr:hypothetical protein [Rickettsiales bacterium]